MTSAPEAPPDPDRLDPAKWRGVAAEEADEVSGAIAELLAARTRRLARELFTPHRRGLAVLAVVIVVNQLAVLAGPWLVDVGINHAVPSLSGHGPDRWVPLAATVAGVLAAAAVQAWTFRTFIVLSGRIGSQVLYRLRVRLFDHVEGLSLGFHERYTSGRVISRLTSDLEAINDLFEEGIQAVVIAVLSSVTVSVAMILLDPVLGLIAVASLPIVVAITAWYRRAAAVAYRATRETVAVVIVQFVESLGGIRAVQAFGREPRNQAIFETVNDSYRRANARTMRLLGVFLPSLTELGYLTTAIVIAVGAVLVLHHHTSIGVLAALYLYLRRFYDPLQELGQFTNLFQGASAAVEKIAGVLDEAPAVAPPQHPARPATGEGREGAGVAGAEVRLEGVRFAYRPELAPVLGAAAPFDLDVPPGQTLAVVGPTGAGKSTVARLLARFYDPVEGRVTLDGVDVRRLEDEWFRSQVVTVTQESFLFTGTVADNIAFGRPGATRAAIEAATASIGADAFVDALPAGYETEVHKRGGRLSAGQRQLVSFARAALADPAVLILDEATSSLDLPSERLVQRALSHLLAERTAVIIAHRLSTVEIADRVVVIDGGAIVEDGSPEELRGGDGHYARLHTAWQESVARTGS